MLYAQFSGKICDIFNDRKQLIRRLHAGNDIVNVQVSGDGNDALISIVMKNGKTVVYKATGQLIRR